MTGWTGLQWPGSTVWIVASGPSLTREDCDAVRDGRGEAKCIVINTSFLLAPWADVLYACDDRWWKHHMQDVREMFHGELWTQDQVNGVKYIRSTRKSGLSGVPGVIHQGANSGYQAIGLAHQAGAKRIRLLGFDMCLGFKQKKHWHGDHPSPMNSSLPFDYWLEQFTPLAHDLEAEGIEVVNCTRESALQCFAKRDLGEQLNADRSLSDTRAAGIP